MTSASRAYELYTKDRHWSPSLLFDECIMTPSQHWLFLKFYDMMNVEVAANTAEAVKLLSEIWSRAKNDMTRPVPDSRSSSGVRYEHVHEQVFSTCETRFFRMWLNDRDDLIHYHQAFLMPFAQDDTAKAVPDHCVGIWPLGVDRPNTYVLTWVSKIDTHTDAEHTNAMFEALQAAACLLDDTCPRRDGVYVGRCLFAVICGVEGVQMYGVQSNIITCNDGRGGVYNYHGVT